MKLIKKCPYCGEELKFDGIHLVCDNENCVGRNRVSFYEAIRLLEIKGIGESMAYSFFDAGFQSPFDIFSKDFNSQLLIRNGIWNKNVEKVFEKIISISHIKLETVIQMAGFAGMGLTTAKQCAKEYAGQKFDYYGLDKIVVEGFSEGGDKRTKISNIIYKLNEFGIEVDMPEEDRGVVVGIEMTGSPKPYWDSKDTYMSAINEFGDFKHEKITKSKYLITDDSNSSSSKMITAKKLGITIMTYVDFYKLIRE